MSSLFSKRGATDLLRESIGLIRRLWAGETVPIEEYPLIGTQLRWKPGATGSCAYGAQAEANPA